MRAEEKNMVERIMDTETMGYAYEYPYGGGARKEYMLALVPENLLFQFYQPLCVL